MQLRDSSPAVAQLNLSPDIRNRTSYSEAATDSDLLSFWPEIQTDPRRGRGSNTYVTYLDQRDLIKPDPVRPPFPEGAPYKSIFALATDDCNDDDPALSRELALTFQILLPEPRLVGGIAFAGYPALGYAIDKFGRTSSNYGLPREMRISIASLPHASHASSSNFLLSSARIASIVSSSLIFAMSAG